MLSHDPQARTLEFMALEPLRRDQEHPAVALVDPARDRIKVEANKRDVPYQSLIKMGLSEKVG